MKLGRRHLVIPDTQIKPGVPLDHIGWIAQYAIDKTPDVIIIGGDWADMSSLSSYDVGKKSFEGKKYIDDIKVANDALRMLMEPIQAEVAKRKRQHRTQWNPEFHVTLGNHEQRIVRAVDEDRKLEGLVYLGALDFKKWGFNVYQFLQPVIIDGIVYCHFFASGVMGRPITTARALLTKLHQSCFAFHQQGKDIAYGKRADGTRLTAIISGSCYLHDEDYLNPQTNDVWKGIWMLNEVNNGSFDETSVSLNFLKERYGKKKAGSEAGNKGGLDQSIPDPVPNGG